MAKVYSYDGTTADLLIRSDGWVINGGWKLTKRRDGTFWIPKGYICGGQQVHFVMEAPCDGGYNQVLAKAQEIMDTK